LIHIIPVLTDNYCYLIEGNDKECLIVDPGEFTPVTNYITAHTLKPVMILNTHHHGDHVGGNAELANAYNIPVNGPEFERAKIPLMTKGLKEGDIVTQSGLTLKVIETPGHTKGHIILYVPAFNALFSGDTLFSMGCGRLFEGTPADMFDSLQKIKSFPPETNIYCGHEYTKANGNFALHLDPENIDIIRRMKDVETSRAANRPTIPVTLGEELKTNPFLRAQTLEEFTRIRSLKDHF